MRDIAAVLLILVSLAIARPVEAQPAERNELSVFGGISLLDAEAAEFRNPYILALPAGIDSLIYPPPFGHARSLDASGEFGVRYGRDVTETLTFVTDFSVAPGHRVTERFAFPCPEACIAVPGLALYAPDYLFSQRIVAYHYGGGMRLNLRQGPLVPSVLAGLGGVTYSGDQRSDSQFTVRLGGSVTAAVGRMTTGIEVLDVMVPDQFFTNDLEHDVHVRISLGVKF